MTHIIKKGFNQRSQSLHFRKGQYDPTTQSVPDESFLNGDARNVQPGRGFLFDGVDSQVQIIVSNQGALYVSAQLEDGSLDSDISITYDTDRYKIEKSNNEAVQNIKVWTVSNATTAEKKSKELESNLFAWFKCDEDSLDDSFDSSGNDNDGKIANASLSTFHTTSDKFYSWQNNAGYTYDSNKNRYIPRDESDNDKDVQGNSLQYKGKVPYTVYAKDSNCGKFDGVGAYVDTGNRFDFAHSTGEFHITMVVLKRANLGGGFLFSNIDLGASNYNNIGLRADRNSFGELILVLRQDDGTYNLYNEKIKEGLQNVNQFYKIEIIGDGNKVELFVDSVKKAEMQVGTTVNTQANNYLLIGARKDTRTSPSIVQHAEINVAEFKIQNPNNSADNAHYVFSESNDNFVYDVSGNGYHGEIKNASLADFWSEKQDQFHYNFENGFDLWLDGNGNKLYVPFDENGNSIKTQGDTISGFSFDSKHEPSTNFHNGAETRFDTDANDPHFGDYKRAVSDTGLHPSNNVSGDDRYYIRKLPDDEADRFTLYLNDQVDPQKLKTELFTQ